MSSRHTSHGLPSQGDVEMPLLRLIQSRGGAVIASDSKSEMMAELGAHFGLTTHQMELNTNTEPPENLWWNWIRHVRRKLVAKGLLAANIHNVWKLTPLAEERL